MGLNKKSTRLRVYFSLLIFLLVLIWPVFHMFLTTHESFSPWRLAGWGMYSRPYPDEFSSLQIFTCHESLTTCQARVREALSQMEASGKMSSLFQIYEFNHGHQLTEMKLDQETLDSIDQDLKGVFNFPKGPYISQIMDKISRDLGRESFKAIAVISEQRLDLKMNRLYVKKKHYIF